MRPSSTIEPNIGGTSFESYAQESARFSCLNSTFRDLECVARLCVGKDWDRSIAAGRPWKVGDMNKSQDTTSRLVAPASRPAGRNSNQQEIVFDLAIPAPMADVLSFPLARRV